MTLVNWVTNKKSATDGLIKPTGSYIMIDTLPSGLEPMLARVKYANYDGPPAIIRSAASFMIYSDL
jgi:hypothetical protein